VSSSAGHASEPGRVVIVRYDPSWPLRFAVERARLQGALGRSALAIEHVGSTAVPGLSSRPILDIAIALPGLAAAAEAVARLQRIGYERDPQGDLEDRFLMRREEGTARAFHASLTAFGTRSWRCMLWFRDRLRTDQALVREYEELKQRLVARPSDPQVYSSAKKDFIRRLLEDEGPLTPIPHG
jgi:GrpB-like predicted nucleotidyltransferase (UPF0157 family)